MSWAGEGYVVSRGEKKIKQTILFGFFRNTFQEICWQKKGTREWALTGVASQSGGGGAQKAPPGRASISRATLTDVRSYASTSSCSMQRLRRPEARSEGGSPRRGDVQAFWQKARRFELVSKAVVLLSTQLQHPLGAWLFSPTSHCFPALPTFLNNVG